VSSRISTWSTHKLPWQRHNYLTWTHSTNMLSAHTRSGKRSERTLSRNI